MAKRKLIICRVDNIRKVKKKFGSKSRKAKSLVKKCKPNKRKGGK